MPTKKTSGAGEERERGGFKASRHASKQKKASAAGNKTEQKRAAEDRERAGKAHSAHEGSAFLQGGKIAPRRIDGTESAARDGEADPVAT